MHPGRALSLSGGGVRNPCGGSDSFCFRRELHAVSPATDEALHRIAARGHVRLVAATDNNRQGDVYAERIQAIAAEAAADYIRSRPRGDDWNEFSGRKLRMLLCCAGTPFLIMLDTNIVAVSLPSIARDLKGGFTDVEWVVSAYILPFAALLMPAGRSPIDSDAGACRSSDCRSSHSPLSCVARRPICSRSNLPPAGSTGWSTTPLTFSGVTATCVIFLKSTQADAAAVAR
jgi:hypothetical protein